MTKTTDAAKQLTYLAAALKAPRILDVAGRLADQARDAGWAFEDYLAAVLEREVSARNASGAQLRSRSAGFSPQTLKDFDFDAQPAIRNQIAALAGGRLPHRGPQHRPARTTRHRHDTPRHRARHPSLPARPTGPVRHRH